MATFITDALTPLLNSFNQSKAAALALITVTVSAVSGKIFPSITNEIKNFAIAGKQSTIAARQAAVSANRALTKAEEEAGKTRGVITKRSLMKMERAFRESLGVRIRYHKDFTTSIFNQEKE